MEEAAIEIGAFLAINLSFFLPPKPGSDCCSTCAYNGYTWVELQARTEELEVQINYS